MAGDNCSSETTKVLVIGNLEEMMSGFTKKQKFFLLYIIIGWKHKDAAHAVGLQAVTAKNWLYNVPGFREVRDEFKQNAHLYRELAQQMLDSSDDTEIGHYLTGIIKNGLKNWDRLDDKEQNRILKGIDTRTKMMAHRGPSIAPPKDSYEDRLLAERNKR